MHTRYLATLLLITGLLSACGSGKPGTATVGGNGKATAETAARDSGDASAAQVAAEARGDVDCQADTVPNPPGTPVDDIVGVHPGMSYEQAAHAVLCSNPLVMIEPETGGGFEIQTYGQTVRQGFSARFAEPRVQLTRHEYMQQLTYGVHPDLKPGQSKWFVGTMGMPGKEQVISAARDQWFDEGHNPTIDNIEQALLAKYGTPTQRTDRANYHQLSWAYDPRGRLITETSSLYNQCRASADPDGGVGLSADCGIAVAANIIPMSSNPALAQNLQVGVVDQAGGYRALTDTKQGLQAMDAARRAKQVQDASKNAQAPQP